jgi:hypothetical protein
MGTVRIQLVRIKKDFNALFAEVDGWTVAAFDPGINELCCIQKALPS